MATKKADHKTKDVPRPPIVTFMGHVDHGKTSILDYIRHSSIQEKEYAGITQHTGAYQVVHNDKKITFIDTPGHAAFTQMRSRGGKAADIVVLVVAADEGVMPQTKEAIAHAKAAGATIIVAINKMDKPGADPKNVMQGLSLENVLTEEYGGDVISVNVSAHTGEGIEDLLDAILVVSEILDLKGDPNGELEGIVIESKVDKRKGVVVSCILRNGSIKIGDIVLASGYIAKIKSIIDDQGKKLKSATLGDAVEILGFKEIPSVGDLLLSEGSELAELAVDEDRVDIVGTDAKRTVAIIVKTDTQGTLEAVKSSLANLVTSSVESTYALKFLHCATGVITDSDVMLAQSSGGVVVGFNVSIPNAVKEYANTHNVTVRTYQTIYDLVDDAKDLLEGTATKEESKIKGRAKIIKTFKLDSGDVIAGCEVVAGALRDSSRVAIYDKDPANLTDLDTPIYNGEIKKLKQKRDDVSMVGKGVECGVLLKPKFKDLSKGLWIEVY